MQEKSNNYYNILNIFKMAYRNIKNLLNKVFKEKINLY